MDFQNLNRLNVVINILSGNLLPVTYDKTEIRRILIIYASLVWSIHIAFLSACILGVFHVSKEKALQDSTVSILVSLEVILLIGHLHNRKNLLRGLIEKLNSVLTVDNDTLRNAVIKTVKPLEKPLRIYTIAAFISVIGWTSMPLVKIFQKNQFTYEDYQVPFVMSKEPFSMNVFAVGVFFEAVACGYVILKKIGLDVYTMHLILLATSQYRYLRIKLMEIFRDAGGTVDYDYLKKLNGASILCRDDMKAIREQLNLLIHHHNTVVQIAVALRELLSPNISLLYLNNVFRFCFLGFMIVTSSDLQFGTCMVIMYTLSALAQLFVVCFCIEQLLEASMQLTDDAFHEKWYNCDTQLRHMFMIIILANKLECRLSNFRSMNLTLPSFVSILNQAYSVCLLFLGAQ